MPASVQTIRWLSGFALAANLVFTNPVLASSRQEKKKEDSQQLRLMLRDMFFLEQAAFQKSLSQSDFDKRLGSLRELWEKTSPRLTPELARELGQALPGPGKTPEGLTTPFRNFRHRVTDAFEIDSSPARPPDALLGQRLFQRDCVSCHGPQGQADGPLTPRLSQKPTAWTAGHLQSEAPLMILNALLLGSKGTPMPSYEEHYSHHELWSLSFLIPCLPFRERIPQRLKQWQSTESTLKKSLFGKGLSYRLLAQLTDEELLTWVGLNIPASKSPDLSAEAWKETLRAGAAFSSDLPRR